MGDFGPFYADLLNIGLNSTNLSQNPEKGRLKKKIVGLTQSCEILVWPELRGSIGTKKIVPTVGRSLSIGNTEKYKLLGDSGMTPSAV